MATVAENLQTRRAAIAVELAAITSSASGGKPTYSINGQSVSHTEYRMSLLEELAAINDLLADPTTSATAGNEGPFEAIGEGA